MTLQFSKATKAKSRARIALVGPSGSGKTYTAVRIAGGMVSEGERIALIDTEHGSASKYSTRFDFDVLELEEHSVEMFLEAIKAASDARYPVLVVDSLSHAWSGRGGVLELVARLSSSSSGSNFNAWDKATPLQNSLISALLSYPGHVIACMRVKTDYVMTEYEGKNGRMLTKPVKVGLAPVQRKGVEYEFDLVCELDSAHILRVTKTRNDDLDGLELEKAGEDFGERIRAWLDEGFDPLEEWRKRVDEAEASGSLKALVGRDGLKPLAEMEGGAWAVDKMRLIDAALCRLSASVAPTLNRDAVLSVQKLVEAAGGNGDRQRALAALSLRLDALDDALDGEKGEEVSR